MIRFCISLNQLSTMAPSKVIPLLTSCSCYDLVLLSGSRKELIHLEHNRLYKKNKKIKKV